MKPVVWLASFPKSGNTWFRLILANLWPDRAASIGINDIGRLDGMASGRVEFDRHLLLDSGLLTPDEAESLRPRYHRWLSQNGWREPGGPENVRPIEFFKTHDAWTLTSEGEPLLGGHRAASAALLFVRDPRDVAASFAHHQSQSIDAAIDAMADPQSMLANPRGGQPEQLRQRLLGWSGFAASWLKQTEVPVAIVRYEDLHADPIGTVGRALAFVGHAPEEDRIAAAVAAAAFDRVQREEAETGFIEAPRRLTRFFRRGIAGGWRLELSPEQVVRIERDHAQMMRRLGYALSPDRDLVGEVTV